MPHPCLGLRLREFVDRASADRQAATIRETATRLSRLLAGSSAKAAATSAAKASNWRSVTIPARTAGRRHPRPRTPSPRRTSARSSPPPGPQPPPPATARRSARRGGQGGEGHRSGGDRQGALSTRAPHARSDGPRRPRTAAHPTRRDRTARPARRPGPGPPPADPRNRPPTKPGDQTRSQTRQPRAQVSPQQSPGGSPRGPSEGRR